MNYSDAAGQSNTSGGDGTNLIVDLPIRCGFMDSSSRGPSFQSGGRDGSVDEAISSSADTPTRAVHFATKSEVAIIECRTEAEIPRCWYSSIERDYLKHIMMRDLRIMSSKLATTPMVSSAA